MEERLNLQTKQQFAGQLTFEKKENQILTNRLSTVIHYIEERYAENISLKDLALQCYLCPSYFIREFKKKYNVSPYQYLISKRLLKAEELVRSHELTLKEICSQVGYEDISSFSKLFKRRFGMSPDSYRKVVA